MPKETTNYSLKKPLYSENADVGVLNENLDALDEILTPTIEDIEPEGNKGTLSTVLGWQIIILSATPKINIDFILTLV